MEPARNLNWVSEGRSICKARSRGGKGSPQGYCGLSEQLHEGSRWNLDAIVEQRPFVPGQEYVIGRRRAARAKRRGASPASAKYSGFVLAAKPAAATRRVRLMYFLPNHLAEIASVAEIRARVVARTRAAADAQSLAIERGTLKKQKGLGRLPSPRTKAARSNDWLETPVILEYRGQARDVPIERAEWKNRPMNHRRRIDLRVAFAVGACFQNFDHARIKTAGKIS